MSRYVRPAIAEQTYRDSDGGVIQYGERWPRQGPPQDSYSVGSHPERFEPLHQIADALIDYLQHNYDVQVTEDLSYVEDLRPPIDALRAVRLKPDAENAAPLTFVFTDYPGLIVHAGLLHDFPSPVCGCDACDETWESVADELEWRVLAVVSGGFREEVRGSLREPWIWYQLKAADGSQSAGGSRDATSEADANLRTASARLEALSGRWAAWPRK